MVHWVEKGARGKAKKYWGKGHCQQQPWYELKGAE